jgi:hypothetical protein
MNVKKINDKLYKLALWFYKEDKYDYNNNLYPKPKHYDLEWSGKRQFIEKLIDTENKLIKNKDYEEDIKYNCLLCKEKNISNKIFKYQDIIWKNSLLHYIDRHNIKPQEDFMDFIYNLDHRHMTRKIKFNSEMYTMDNVQYLKLDKNQILIMDALMEHGGYTRKYLDSNNKAKYKYSEHYGLLDFDEDGLEKIIISGRTNRIDEGDADIFLPKDLLDAIDYEYIFHTHPPTPKPGGRVNSGILYEFPSVNDVFHFIEHFNSGITQGSLVITPEGLYNIRKLTFNKKKISIDKNKLYRQFLDIFYKQQRNAIKKYGKNFDIIFFKKVIAHDKSFINNINKVLNKFSLHIDFYPRILSYKNKWIIDTVYLPIYVIEKA